MAKTKGLCVIKKERSGSGLEQGKKPIHIPTNEEDLHLMYYRLDPA
jgi:hypothetical protein